MLKDITYIDTFQVFPDIVSIQKVLEV